ncbi:MAG TPA: rhodanese-like domain-containing protein [Allosphingosinicella sp.]|jgi:rhodanese-related sulfurtransferase
MLRPCLVVLAVAAASPLQATPPPPNPQIDFPGYAQLTGEVRDYRRTRLIGWQAFLAAATDPDVLILDARSERQFAAGHIAGAVNVPLPEFSAERLAEVIGRTDRPILIYCNNNFRNNRPPVALKSGPVALNIPTFIHLVAYGYRNIRELNDVMSIDDPRMPWVRGPGATAAPSLPSAPRRAE